MRFNLFFLLLLFTATATFAQKHQFEIKATIDSKHLGKKLYFLRTKMHGSAEAKPVQVTIENGKFLIKGELDEPERVFFSFNTDVKSDTGALSFFIDKGTISVAISDRLSLAKVSGSKADTDFNSYISKTATETRDFNEFYEMLKQKAQQAANRDSLQLVFENAYNVYRKAMNTIRLNYLTANPDTFVSLLLLPEITEYTQNYTLTDSLYNLLAAEIKRTPSAKIMIEQFQKARQLAVGAIAPDFSQQTPDGKPVKLSDFRGKYLLVDFWASWCGPCRQENPNVVKIYNEFKSKNFTVLGVSLDRPGSKSAWIKAINDDNLTWTHISDLNFWKNEVAQLYNVTSIPQNFLLDPQGKIIAKNLRGEDLKSALLEIIK